MVFGTNILAQNSKEELWLWVFFAFGGVTIVGLLFEVVKTLLIHLADRRDQRLENEQLLCQVQASNRSRKSACLGDDKDAGSDKPNS